MFDSKPRNGVDVRDFRQFSAHAQPAINIRHKSPVNGNTVSMQYS